MNKRITTLDGIRGLAVLFVVAFHLINNQVINNYNAHPNFIENIIVKVTYFGWTGVDLFFVMSGFLIGSILLENKNSANFFKTFYVRRFLRIIPIYYLLLLIFFVLKNTSIYDSTAYIFAKDINLGYYFLFLQNFVMTHNNHFGPEALTPSWSLAVEEQFYLIIPWIIYYLKPKHLKYFIAFCLIIAPISRHFCQTFYGQYTLLNCRIDSPAIGLLIAILNREIKITSLIKDNYSKFQILIIGLIFTGGILYLFANVGPFNHTIIAVIYGSILLLALHSTKGVLYSILTSKWLVFFGGISYFLYLYHQIVNGLLHLIFLKQLTPILNGMPSLILTIIGFAISIILSVLSYKFFESKLIKLSHNFKY